MGQVKTGWVFALLIFACVCALRISLTFSHDGFLGDSTYTTLRQTSVDDPLSYGGRELLLNPVSTWLFVGLQTVFFTEGLLKLFMAIFGASIVLMMYIYCKRMNLPTYISIGCALCSGGVPLHYLLTLSRFDATAFLYVFAFFVLVQTSIYLTQKDRPISHWLVLWWIILILLDVRMLVLVAGLGLYWWISFLYGEQIAQGIKELFYTTIILGCGWFYLLFYPAFSYHGGGIFTVSSIFSEYVTLEALLPLLPQLGILLLALAAASSYFTFSTRTNLHNGMFLSACAFSLILATVFGFLSADQAFLFLSIPSLLLVVNYFSMLGTYLGQTKVEQYSHIILFSHIVLLFLSLWPLAAELSLSQIEQASSPDYISALTYFSEVSDPNSLILVPAPLSQEVMFYGQRKTLVDTNVLMADRPLSRAAGVQEVYDAKFRVDIEEVSLAFSFPPVVYVILDARTDLSLGLSDCFVPAFLTMTTQVYKLECGV
jgi:hypothetical protein